ncbi:MAG: hypothetical protein JNL69_11010 [Bacteroidia bacterium]|nr:hypothetical protein [Bacteroidia bacterium]
MAIIGTCRVKDIVSQKPTKLWNEYSNRFGIDRKRYFEYYEGKEVAVGIFLKDKKKLTKSISLTELRKLISGFHPPQTFRYIKEPLLLRKISDK